MGKLEVTGLTKIYADGTRALDDVSLVAHPGRVLTLLGPSGCGKSTLLRIVAGLEEHTSGSLLLDGARLDDVPAGRRGVGFVFQNYALYPHLTVEGNLSLALETQRVPREEVRARVREIAGSLEILELLDKRPAELSGGQQQRVALGRALVRRPRISLSDDLVGMRSGRILQSGPPLEVFRRPADLFVATFVGSPRMTIWQGRRDGDRLACRGVAVPLPPGLPSGGELCVGIRPEEAELSPAPLEGGWPARRVVVEPLGSRVLVTVRVGEEQARVLAEPADWPEALWLRWPPGRLGWFDAATGARLGGDGHIGVLP